MYSIHRASGPKSGEKGEGRHPVPVNVGFYVWVVTSWGGGFNEFETSPFVRCIDRFLFANYGRQM